MQNIQFKTGKRSLKPILCAVFKTQEVKPWFTGDTFWALPQLRGMESRAPESLAEAFYARKVIL